MEKRYMSQTTELHLADIRRDGDTQARAMLNPERVADYADRLAGGDEPPPLTVVFDGKDHWLANGFHRVAALMQAGRVAHPCNVVSGDRADAFDIGVEANIDNGEPLNARDRRRIIGVWVKRDPNQSNRVIARRLRVSDHTVAVARKELEATAQVAQSTSRVGADGVTRELPSRPAAIPQPPEVPPEPAPSPPALKLAPPEPIPASLFESPKASPPPPVAPPPPPPAEIPPPPPTGPPGTFDRTGNRIPRPEIAEAFRRDGELAELAARIRELMRAVLASIAEGDPLYKDIQGNQIEADLINAYNWLNDARPWAVCPYCGGDSCKACGLQGWIGKEMYQLAPEEMKAVTRKS
jgi:hypothetical protein